MNVSPCVDRDCADHGSLERPRYFPRQLITPAELNLEAAYFRDRLRRHNRLLHGWGVVCGALVCLVAKADGTGSEPWKVKVQAGYVLGPYGDEIVIDCPRTVSLRTSGVTGACGEPSSDVPDPWCTEVVVPREAGPLYVCVKYREIMARPVRVQPVGCGCDDGQCEYSRWRDGYEIGVLPRRPGSAGGGEAAPAHLDDVVHGPVPACPPCPDEPWVVLARVDVNAEGEVTIDNCESRRLAASFARFWWQCTPMP